MQLRSNMNPSSNCKDLANTARRGVHLLKCSFSQTQQVSLSYGGWTWGISRRKQDSSYAGDEATKKHHRSETASRASKPIGKISPNLVEISHSAETNTPDIRIFVRFALFEHNLCYPTIHLQPCGFAYALFVRPLSWDAHNWWNKFSYQDLCSAYTIIVPKIHISTNYSTIRSFDMWIFEYTKVVFVSALILTTPAKIAEEG